MRNILLAAFYCVTPAALCFYRLRNDAVMTMGLYFSKWSGRSALVASAPNGKKNVFLN